MTHPFMKMSHEQYCSYLMVYGTFYEMYNYSSLIFTTFITYHAVLRSLWRLGHENISTAILPLPLIQEAQLSVTGERMCTKYW